MKKKFLTISFFALMLVGCGQNAATDSIQNSLENQQIKAHYLPGADPLNASYVIDNRIFSLTNGLDKASIPDMTIHYLISVWDKPVTGDLNADGSDDAALILTQTVEQGKGLFYYLTASVQDPKTKKFWGSSSVFLGDRIVIENLSIENGVITVAFHSAKENDSSATFITRRFTLNKFELREQKEK